jgi:FSR family fosmidomycin resistance protein-like MFS transporter
MKKQSMALLVVSHAAADISQGSIPVMLPFFIAEHHISFAAAASFVFAVNIVSTLAQPIFGHIVDRHSRPWLIPASMLVIGLGVSFIGITPSYSLGLAGLMAAGLAVAVFHPEGARLMNFLAGESKATAMSLFGIGGQLGFAIGPLITTVALVTWGLKGTVVLFIPSALMAALLMAKLPGLSEGYPRKGKSRTVEHQAGGRDEWPAFTFLTVALLFRSVIFYGLSTFLPLFWIYVLHQSKAAGGTAVAVLFGASIAGNLVGGRTADQLGFRRVTIGAFVLLTVFLPLLLFSQTPGWSMFLLVLIGFVMSAPFGAMVALGQSYLPNRVGLASGITLGVAFSFGGLTTPLLGWIGDHYGLRATIGAVAFVPVICLVMALLLPRPKPLLAPGAAQR